MSADLSNENLTYKAPRCNALILGGGRRYRPDRHRREPL